MFCHQHRWQPAIFLFTFLAGISSIYPFVQLFWSPRNATHEEVSEGFERMRRENEELRSMLKKIDDIQIEQSEKERNIPLIPDELKKYETEVAGLQVSTRQIAEVVVKVETTKDREILEQRIRDLEVQLATIQENAATARELVETQDPKSLDKLITPTEGELELGTIKTPEGTQVYRKSESEEFLRDAEQGIKTGTPTRLHLGTPDGGTYDCVGAPGKCRSLEIKNPDGSSARIQLYYEKRSPNEERALARYNRKELAGILATLPGTICAWYDYLAKGKALPKTLRIDRLRSESALNLLRAKPRY